MKICGVVIWYNPDDIFNIYSYINDIERLFIIDNSENENLDKYKLLDKNYKITYIWNKENLGIAKALNIGIKEAMKEKYDFILTMDQDSEYEVGAFNRYIDFIKNDKEENIGIYASIPLISKKKYIFDEKYKYAEVAMTSGSIVNLKIIKKLECLMKNFL